MTRDEVKRDIYKITNPSILLELPTSQYKYFS